MLGTPLPSMGWETRGVGGTSSAPQILQHLSAAAGVRGEAEGVARDGVRGGGHVSLEVAPVLVMRGWPGDIADPGTGRCCFHPKAAAVGEPPPHYCPPWGSGHLL